MKKILLIGSIAYFSCWENTFAQVIKNDSLPELVKKIQGVTGWLTSHGFQIRKTLDGSKSESKPAGIVWTNDYEARQFYSVLDVGIKLSEVSLFENPGSNISLLFYPKLEWHKNNIPDDDKKKNSLTGGVNTEFLWHIADRWYARPFVTGSFDYKNDYIKHLKTIQTKGYLSFSGQNTGEPGAQIKDKTLALRFRYYPYSGFEFYRSTDGSKKSGSMWANRLYFEFYPVSRFEYQYVQITFDYTYRKIMRDNLYNKGDMKWLSVGFNVFPDGKGKLGLGLEYSHGEDPFSNFVKTKSLVLGIKFKI